MTIKKNINFLIIVLCLILTAPLATAQDERLVALYFNRPPYYDTVEGRATGLLIELTRKIFSGAGITPVFVEVPPQRILYYLKDPKKKVCSIGWFKTEERKKFAKFSRPIYRSKPLVILTTKVHQARIEEYPGLRDVFFDQSLILAKIESFSYGTTIDGWINNYAPRIHRISSDQSVLPQLLLINRASYMLVAPEEVNTMLAKAKTDTKAFVAISKSDIPQGHKRYIIYGKTIDDHMIQRIDHYIPDMSRTEPGS